MQNTISCMKQDLDLRRSGSEKRIQSKKKGGRPPIKFIIPISALIFIVIVLCSAIGILMFKVFDTTSTPTPSAPSGQYIQPDYATGTTEPNLVFNPSFEELDPKTNLPYSWDSQDTYDILTEDGETVGDVTVKPFDGENSLRLTTSDVLSSVTVTQTLFVAETPKALNFSAWGNSDLFSSSSSFVPFMVSVELEFLTEKKYVHTALFSTQNKGWQYTYNYVSDLQSDSLYAIHISCSVSRGIGSVFFDNVSIVFYD